MELPSGLGLLRKAWRAVTASALALLIIGAGASLGMSGPVRTARLRSAAAGTLATGPGASSPGPQPAEPAGSTTTTSTPPTTVNAGGYGGLAEFQPQTSGGSAPVPATGGVTSPASIDVPASSAATTTTAPPSGTAGGPSPGAGLPAVGTYTYNTTGSQQITILGATTYPAQTPVVVSNDGCGVSSSWKPSSGGSETVVECPVNGGVRVISESSTVSQDGYSTTQDFACGPDAFIPVTSGQVGQTWRWQCRSSDGETLSQVVELVGPRTAVVGGIAVSAEEVSVRATLSGLEQGTMSSDCWLTSNATPVKQTGEIDVVVGAITYTSHYDLQLTSLTPAS